MLSELDRLAPDAPFLALGQTVLWDEPVKAGVVARARELGFPRPWVAGVHDTDYFAKLPGRASGPRFLLLPHNDTTTRALWSAAGEFSCLFGSETVVTRDDLHRAGMKIGKVERARPGLLDRITEAWGWRGLVDTTPEPVVVADLPLGAVFEALHAGFDWALAETAAIVEARSCPGAERRADELRALFCDADRLDPRRSLASYYRSLLPDLHRFVCPAAPPAAITATSELLRFNRATAHLPRFDLVRFFVRPETRERAIRAYDETVRGTEVYTLDRFGTGAIPFDLYVPGHGRGTLRLGTRGLVVMTPKPLFASVREPIGDLEDLAAVIEDAFGPDCVLIGKAIPLIGMLAAEFVFVFHAGGSGYLPRCRELHRRLASEGMIPRLNPILRVTYRPWDALATSCVWLRLPEPLRGPFGSEDVCAPGFARRWRTVAEEQERLLERLASLRRPLDLIRFLAEAVGKAWLEVAAEYEEIHRRSEALARELEAIKARKAGVVEAIRAAKRRRGELEREKGEHWRARIFEKEPTPEDWRRREEFGRAIEETIARVRALEREWRALQDAQDALVRSPDVQRDHERRRDIEVEAEIARGKLVRHAIVASRGLRRAGHRPAAWWFPLLSPDGAWFEATHATARYELEFLT